MADVIDGVPKELLDKLGQSALATVEESRRVSVGRVAARRTERGQVAEPRAPLSLHALTLINTNKAAP